MVEAAHQAAQGCVGHRFIPMVKNAERSFGSSVARTALSIADIHSNAVRLRSKPMPPNAAKTTRTMMRTQKRTITWVDRNSWVKFGSCAKDLILLREIVAADRPEKHVGVGGAVGTLVMVGGTPVRCASTNAIKMGSGKSAWQVSID